jgi:Glyoxalase-like domain
MMIDHVAVLVPSAEAKAQEFRECYGLGLDRGAELPLAGTRMHTVWLEPPQYLEFHAIENREVAATTTSGRIALAREAAGFGMLGWAVLVGDLEAVSERLGIAIFDHTIPHGEGTLRGWRAVGGPSHLPFFIDYPNNGDRFGRMKALYDRAGHTCSPRWESDRLSLSPGMDSVGVAVRTRVDDALGIDARGDAGVRLDGGGGEHGQDHLGWRSEARRSLGLAACEAG